MMLPAFRQHRLCFRTTGGMADLDLESARSRGHPMLVRRRATKGKRSSNAKERDSRNYRDYAFRAAKRLR
jgi:hypothetical protein